MMPSRMICRIALLFLILNISIVPLSAEEEKDNENERNNGNGDQRQVYDFEEDCLGIPDDYSKETLAHNTNQFTDFLNTNASYASLYFADKTFHFYPGVYGQNIIDFEMFVNGTLQFHRPDVTYVNHYDRPEPCIFIENSDGITLSSPDPSFDYVNENADGDGGINDDEYFIDTEYATAKRGIIDGRGAQYWGVPFIGYLELIEFRPDLLILNRTTNVLIEYLIFRDAPLYTLLLHDQENLEVRYISIVARRTHDDGHTLLDLSAFNTDGIDVSGNDVYVHDVDIWNQDDCIAVKDSYDGVSSNMLFERIHASGLGLTVGSIGGTTVRNITFRDSLLYRSFKGIYMKFRVEDSTGYPGLVENVVYENITIVEPEQWGIWIGPAQQAISGNPCKASPCSLCWPSIPFTECKGSETSQYKNITLRDINIYNPLGSPGVILGSDSFPIEGITFDNVVVSKNPPPVFQNLNRFKLFPGLQEPIQDPYMHPVNIWIYTILACALGVGIAGLATLGFMRLFGMGEKEGSTSASAAEPLLEKEKEESNWMLEHKTPIFIVASIVVAVAVQFIFRTQEHTFDKTHYFTCEGVVDGVATGDTWPVPSCFTDETTSSS